MAQSGLILLVICLLCASTSSFNYFIYAPEWIRPFSSYTVSLLLQNHTDSVSAECKLIANDKTVIHKESLTLTPNKISKFIAPVPALPINSNVTLSCDSTDDEIKFSGRTMVRVAKEPPRKNFIFIETDKPVYKGGETVKFRVLTVNNQLLPHAVSGLEIRVQDPALNIIKRYLNSTARSDIEGYFGSELTLPNEPMLGKWNIVAMINMEAVLEKKTFLVDEYVLPRFDITIAPTEEITRSAEEVILIIGAKYVFGKDVRGSAVASYANGSMEPALVEKFDAIKGLVAVKTGKLPGWSTWTSLNVTLNFTETLTNNSRVSSRAFPTLLLDYEVEILPKTDTAIVPGAPLIVKVILTDHKGMPWPKGEAPSKVSFPEISVSPGPEVLPSDVPIDERGVAQLTIPTSKDTKTVAISVKIGNSKVQFLNYVALQSASGSFLFVQPPNSAKVGQVMNFKVNTTSHANELVQAMVISNFSGAVVESTAESKTGKDFTIAVKATEDMTQGATILVLYKRADDEIVAGFADFSVRRAKENSVNISVGILSGKGYAEPGLAVKFSVNTSPAAFVGLMAVDEALLILADGNEIKEHEVEKQLSSKPLSKWTGKTATVIDMLNRTSIILMTNVIFPEVEQPGLDAGVPESEDFNSNGLDMDEDDESGPPEPKANEKNTTSIQKVVREATPVLEPSRTRKDFRESFLFQTGTANSKGVFSLMEQVPDAITTWRITAFSLSQESGLALTPWNDIKQLVVFQPFFIVMNLPFSIIRGERLDIEILVFNYLDEQQTTVVTLEAEGLNRTSQIVEVSSGEASLVRFPVVAKTVGDLTFKVDAQSTRAADSVERKMIVRPEGSRQQASKQVFVNSKGKEPFEKTETFEPMDPKSVVPNSYRAEISVVGDLLGSVANNFERLLRLPMGCGEQNIAGLAPNVIVLSYMNVTSQLTPELRTKMTENIQKGYVRQLKYKFKDGSFSAWGEKKDKSGSTWLTAYVARILISARSFVDTIQEEVITKALDWLKSKQQADGSFVEVGKIIDRQFQGSVNSQITLTAFTLLSFLQTDTHRVQYKSEIDKAVKYLDDHRSKIVEDDNITMAITAYALALAKIPEGNQDLTASSLLSILMDERIPAGSRVIFWTDKKGSSSKAKTVETTAYALLGLLATDQMDKAFPVVSWLISQQNPTGGFYSTPDTVIGLTALGEFAKKTFVKNPNLSIDVTAGESRTFKVDQSNSMILQMQEIKKIPDSVMIKATGSGAALVSLSWTYHVMSTAGESFDLKVTAIQVDKILATAEICIRFTGVGEKPGMTVMEAESLSGYQFDEDQFYDFNSTKSDLKNVECTNKLTHYVFYFEKFTEQEQCYKLKQNKVFKVTQIQDREAKVYDYYHQEVRKTVLYNFKK